VKLRHLAVSRFRGIRELSWFPCGDVVCLIGPGDIGKSTILDALELVFSPRWNPEVDDADFFQCDTGQPLAIEATIGDLPRRLISDAQFGLRLRGFDAVNGVIIDEPDDHHELVITIRFQVTDTLEPTWHVVTQRHPEGLKIGVREREKLGVLRLGAFLDRHLSWAKGSVLSKLTEDIETQAAVLASASRTARQQVKTEHLPQMEKAAREAQSLAAELGVHPNDSFVPALDPAAGLSTQGLVLHEGKVPLRKVGFGSRRLVSLAMQRHVASDAGIVLIDEIETGLEPFRLRRLLHTLALDSRSRGMGIFMTTHAPLTLTQLRAEHLGIVRRSADGTTRVLSPPSSLQGILVKHAEPFLSRRVVVCEGKTELGLLLGLDETQTAPNSLAYHGVGFADGGGCTQVVEAALAFESMEYPTAILADSDQELAGSEGLPNSRVATFLWPGGVATEERVFRDISWQGVLEALDIVVAAGHPLIEQLAQVFQCSPSELGATHRAWTDDHRWRVAIGTAAKAKKSAWFKNIREARKLGNVVARHTQSGTPLDQTLGSLWQWMTGPNG
jgi:putative ATP-dependent endonuclease of the OLD family